MKHWIVILKRVFLFTYTSYFFSKREGFKLKKVKHDGSFHLGRSWPFHQGTRNNAKKSLNFLKRILTLKSFKSFNCVSSKYYICPFCYFYISPTISYNIGVLSSFSSWHYSLLCSKSINQSTFQTRYFYLHPEMEHSIMLFNLLIWNHL